MSPPDRPSAHGWIHRLGIPVWVTGPDHAIHDANAEAVEALGLARGSWCGAPCHQVVGGRDSDGRPVCGPHCGVQDAARRAGGLAPVVMQVGAGCWLEVITIPDETRQSGQWLIHCGRRIETLLQCIAERSGADPSSREPLTARETEILQHLAAGLDPSAIAARLFVSPATVRNHVQHILAKLKVHSTLEAIAVHLLSDQDAGTDPPP